MVDYFALLELYEGLGKKDGKISYKGVVLVTSRGEPLTIRELEKFELSDVRKIFREIDEKIGLK